MYGARDSGPFSGRPHRGLIQPAHRQLREGRNISTTKSITSTLGVIVAGLAVAACGSSAESRETARASGSSLPQGSEKANLKPADFTTNIDNPYWPMKPGSKWVYRESDTEGTKEKVVVEVTDKTKRIANGVEARVIRDTVSENGVPVEITDDWYAQDKAGNIWYLGEFTREFEDGKFRSTKGSFEAGVDGAQAGVIMPAKPRRGLRYRQEYYKGQAEDKGEIVSLREQAEVPFGHFRRGRVLMTKDTNPLEPKILEFKFYARGIGPVLAVGVSGGADREELVRFRRRR